MNLYLSNIILLNTWLRDIHRMLNCSDLFVLSYFKIFQMPLWRLLIDLRTWPEYFSLQSLYCILEVRGIKIIVIVLKDDLSCSNTIIELLRRLSKRTDTLILTLIPLLEASFFWAFVLKKKHGILARMLIA